jgi:hypothetical protein
MYNSVFEHNQRLFLLDEFGLKLQAITNKNAGNHQREIIELIMQFATNSGLMTGKEYADRKNNRRKDIEDPCVCVYGTSTHDEFYAAFNSSHTTSGSLARFIVVDSGMVSGWGDMIDDPDQYPLPDDVRERLRAIMDAKNTAAGNLAMLDRKSVVFGPGVVESKREFYNYLRELSGLSPFVSAIYNRTIENALRLAAIYAISIDSENPILDMEAWEWGKEFALWSSNLLIEQTFAYSGDNDHEKTLKRVERMIKAAGESGMPFRMISQRNRNLGKKMLEEHLERLVTDGSVFQKEGPRGGVIFVSIDFFKESENSA